MTRTMRPAMRRMAEEIKLIGKKIFRENPVLVTIAGLCPAVAVTTSAANSLVLGVGTLFVLLFASIISYLARNLIPIKFVTGFHIVVAAGLTTMVQLLVDAYFPDISESLGIFVGLIAVNCIVIENAGYGRNHLLGDTIKNGLGVGLGFLLVLLIMGSVREILGAGTFFGMVLLQNGPVDNALFMMVPGGLLTLGVLSALAKWIGVKRQSTKKGAMLP